MPEHFHSGPIILYLLITLHIESSTWGTGNGYELWGISVAQKLKKKKNEVVPVLE
jgi:hypothetical protein